MARTGRHVPFVPQMEATECGAACVAMVLAYHGHHAALAEVREACGVSRDGADALSMVRAARAYGLDAAGVKVELDQLRDLPLPAILHWDFDHFVVLEGVTSRQMTIVDPTFGRRHLPLAEAGRRFTGVALVLLPTPALTARPRTRPSLARYRAVFGTSLPSMVQILLASIGIQLAGLLPPVANQVLIDRVIAPRQDAWLWGLGLALASAVLARALLALVRSHAVQGLQVRVDFALMGRFLDHLLHLPLGFFQQREAGDLVQRVQSNAAVRQMLGTQSITALLDAFLLLGYASLMLAYDLELGLVVLAFGLLRVALTLSFRGRSQRIMAAELAAAGRESGALVEALTGLETTKASGAEIRMVQRWAHRMAARVDAGLERRRLALVAGQAMVLLQGLSTASVFLVGGPQVVAQRMTLGVFATFLVLQGLFLAPLGSLLGALGQLQFLGSHLTRLDDVLTTAPEPSGTADPGRLLGDIEIRGVTFAHSPGAPPVLRDVSVRIRAGEKVAIVGPSGAGKSTLARLLLGLHLPTRGAILFDGRDLRELDLRKVRSQMGVVLQETFLFADTIRANLGLGDEEIPLDRLREAARLACLDDVIDSLPGGYDSEVGDGGSLLSGGQRQRLSLARALAHGPAVLLLDEATSALDLETERRLHANLAGLGCTRILIAHRLATVRDADRILVLRGGRIVQEGTYEELAGLDGPFRSFVEAREAANA